MTGIALPTRRHQVLAGLPNTILLEDVFDGSALNPLVWTKTDTDGKLSLDGAGNLSCSGAAGTPAFGDPGLWTRRAYTRVPGLAFLCHLNATATNQEMTVGLDTNQSGAVGLGFSFNTSAAILEQPSGTIIIGAYAANTDYLFLVVLKGTGHLLYVSGGTFGDLGQHFSLLWDTTTGTDTPVYGAYGSKSTVWKSRLAQVLLVPPRAPSASDLFTRADGALGTAESGQSWSFDSGVWVVSSNAAIGTPTLGSELLTNGNMETGDPPTSWSAGTGTTLDGIADERAGGSGAQSMAVIRSAAGSATPVANSGNITTVADTWYLMDAWIKNIDATSGRLDFMNASWGTDFNSSTVTDTIWTRTQATGRASSTTSRARCRAAATVDLQSVRFDDFSFKALTLSSLFATLDANVADGIFEVNVTLISGTQAGLVLNLDSASSPANFVLAYHDGTNAKLEKCVAGTYTTLVNAAASYAAAATLRVVKVGTSYRLYYNGAAVGTAQTISDGSIATTTRHGLFSTYSSNNLDTFKIQTGF